jgi:hypothetical protein
MKLLMRIVSLRITIMSSFEEVSFYESGKKTEYTAIVKTVWNAYIELRGKDKNCMFSMIYIHMLPGCTNYSTSDEDYIHREFREASRGRFSYQPLYESEGNSRDTYHFLGLP